jgi:hypothetical protein
MPSIHSQPSAVLRNLHKTTGKNRASPRHRRSLPENPPQTKATADPGPPGRGILHSCSGVIAILTSILFKLQYALRLFMLRLD